MKKEYFNGDIKGYPLQITNAYVSYKNTMIPVNAISCVTKNNKRYSYLSAFILLLLTIAAFVAYYIIDARIQPTLALLLGALTLIDFFIIVFLNERLYLLIYSHSKDCIEIPLHWLQKQKLLIPIHDALIQAIEDNHLYQEDTQKDL